MLRKHPPLKGLFFKEDRKNKYHIRKFSVGITSVLFGTLVFITSSHYVEANEIETTSLAQHENNHHIVLNEKIPLHSEQAQHETNTTQSHTIKTTTQQRLNDKLEKTTQTSTIIQQPNTSSVNSKNKLNNKLTSEINTTFNEAVKKYSYLKNNTHNSIFHENKTTDQQRQLSEQHLKSTIKSTRSDRNNRETINDNNIQILINVNGPTHLEVLPGMTKPTLIGTQNEPVQTNKETIEKIQHKVQLPTINNIEAGSTEVSGTSAPNSKVIVTLPDKKQLEVQSDNKGKWHLTSDTALEYGKQVILKSEYS